ncbi:GNAT family N-acetyltransferase [[Clostridium] fimetarium]|uniref:Protein N-acetyltransferase, RimJ/RimL family n=1 Tax=[Clostridium] fimetarium TaxID=99656 RepID=A0A1I0RXV1_9FIRM|nr:GNAT family N-acetyltransferase [[Clostridium] fimetarium]SEW46292.1 Protein N-acetyltransferase, RimJ/RimL family [[Clostridium] fimetarium]
MIETRDLILDKPQYDDWKNMYINLWSQDESAKYMLWRTTKTEENAKIRIEKNIAYMARHPESYLVYEKSSGEAIGFAGMEQIAENAYEDTGIAIGPRFVRIGYGKQILIALVEQACKKYGATEFICSCRNANVASAKLQISCGFIYTYSEERKDPYTRENYILDVYKLKM